MVRAIFAAAALVFGVAVGFAEENLPRGLGHIDGTIHWYDSGCCNQRDCEPVEAGAIRLTENGYVVRYLTSRGFVAEGVIPQDSSNVRQSRDKREHACANPSRVICIYIHMGV